VGQILQGGQNMGKGAVEWIKEPGSAAASAAVAGVGRLGDAMFGAPTQEAPEATAAPVADPNPNHLPDNYLAQVRSAGGDPANFTVMGGSLVSLPGVQAPPVPSAPQAPDLSSASADQLNAFWNSQGVGPGEKAIGPPQAPAPAAPTNNPVVGKVPMSADGRQLAMAQRTMEMMTRQMAGLHADFQRYRNPEMRAAIAQQAAQLGDAIARQQGTLTELGTAPAQRRFLEARATQAEHANRTPGEKMADVMKDPQTYEAFLISQNVDPDHIPLLMERYHASRAAKQGPGAGAGANGPAPAGGEQAPQGVDQQNYLGTIRGNPYMEGLRPLFDPTHGGYLGQAGLTDLLDRAMQYPGANDPNSQVAKVIREGIRARFPGEALQGAIADLGPADDPTQAGWANLLGNNAVGRGMNRALGFVRDVNPFTDDNTGSTNWFANYGRGLKYRNYLRGIGVNEVSPERGI
jgi:hypothetical protein